MHRGMDSPSIRHNDGSMASAAKRPAATASHSLWKEATGANVQGANNGKTGNKLRNNKLAVAQACRVTGLIMGGITFIETKKARCQC